VAHALAGAAPGIETALHHPFKLDYRRKLLSIRPVLVRPSHRKGGFNMRFMMLLKADKVTISPDAMDGGIAD
jgi:hypothetical protein